MSVLAWHFVGERLRDGRPVPKVGQWVSHDGPLVLCASGLHASRDPFDALQYAPGPHLCLVECDGDIIESGDKLVCRRRRIVARKDATKGLRYFARMQALSVVHLWAAPDVVLDYLMTGHARLRDAARAAAMDAAWDAARAAACAAAWDAAMAAARAAAMDAARAAAWAAARDAASDAARADWTVLVQEAFRDELREGGDGMSVKDWELSGGLDPYNQPEPEDESLSPCACGDPGCWIDGNDASNLLVHGRWYAHECGRQHQAVVDDLARSHRVDIHRDDDDQMNRIR